MKNAKSPRTTQPHSLFAEWTVIAKRICRAKHVALFLDFDGTLVGFKKNPEDVHLDASTRRLLERLARSPKVTLVFISGRRRTDLRRRVGVRGTLYLGLHGFESSASSRVNARSRRGLRLAHDLIAQQIQGLPGVWLEDKLASLVLHFRGAPATAATKARAITRDTLGMPGVDLSLLRGKKIWELLVPEVKGKGAAAAEIVQAAGDGALPIYVGDDATDETVFAALAGAITVKVGSNKRTRARYYVRNPEEVRIFLERLEDELGS